MSIWSDIHRRSNGHAVRKEDTVNENTWGDSGLTVFKNIWEYNKSDVKLTADWMKESLNKLKNTNIILTKKTDELKRELDKFKWIK